MYVLCIMYLPCDGSDTLNDTKAGRLNVECQLQLADSLTANPEITVQATEGASNYAVGTSPL